MEKKNWTPPSTRKWGGSSPIRASETADLLSHKGGARRVLYIEKCAEEDK